MTFTDEILSAFIDGELPDAEMGRIAETLAVDPDLAARLDLLRAADNWTADQFGAIDDIPVRAETNELLDRLAGQLALTAGQDNVTSLPAPKATRSWLPAAVAASIALAIGFGAGTLLPPPGQPGATPLQASLSSVIGPEHPYFTALETTPSMTVSQVMADETRMLTPLASFRNTQGQYCREFELTAENHASFNLACKNDQTWTVVASVMAETSPTASVDGYVPASGKGASLLDDLIREQMEGDLLSPEDEATLIKQAWDQ